MLRVIPGDAAGHPARKGHRGPTEMRKNNNTALGMKKQDRPFVRPVLQAPKRGNEIIFQNVNFMEDNPQIPGNFLEFSSNRRPLQQDPKKRSASRRPRFSRVPSPTRSSLSQRLRIPALGLCRQTTLLISHAGMSTFRREDTPCSPPRGAYPMSSSAPAQDDPSEEFKDCWS